MVASDLLAAGLGLKDADSLKAGASAIHPTPTTIMVTLRNGRVALVDRDDYEATIPYKHRSGVVLHICIAQYRWRETVAGKWRYAVCDIQRDHKKYRVQMHRLIMRAEPGQIVDHRDGNRLDNRKENLRLCTNAQNARNATKRTGSTAPYRGITLNKSTTKWRAQITLDYKKFRIGEYADPITAACAYDAAACQLFGEFANPNFTTTAQVIAARSALSSQAA